MEITGGVAHKLNTFLNDLKPVVDKPADNSKSHPLTGPRNFTAPKNSQKVPGLLASMTGKSLRSGPLMEMKAQGCTDGVQENRGGWACKESNSTSYTFSDIPMINQGGVTLGGWKDNKRKVFSPKASAFITDDNRVVVDRLMQALFKFDIPLFSKTGCLREFSYVLLASIVQYAEEMVQKYPENTSALSYAIMNTVRNCEGVDVETFFHWGELVREEWQRENFPPVTDDMPIIIPVYCIRDKMR
jgi:hypothetical protein